MSEKKLDLEGKIGHRFKNKTLLERALTHSSKSTENYERLEFLGDSILDFVVGDFLFKASKKDEGYLTVMRSHYVSENYLDSMFDKLGLQNDVQMGKSMGTSLPKAVKADMIEAIIAAIYLDGGLEKAKTFIEKNFDLSSFESVKDTNFKGKLQSLVQAGFKCSMHYRSVKKENGKYEATLRLDEDEITSAEGNDKTEAEQNCAEKAIKILFKDESI